MGDIRHIMVEQTCTVIQYVPIHLAKRDYDLKRMAERMGDEDEVGDEEGERTPCNLAHTLASFTSVRIGNRMVGIRTAVIVSIHKTKGSCVKYLESEYEYSFHNCAKRS